MSNKGALNVAVDTLGADTSLMDMLCASATEALISRSELLLLDVKRITPSAHQPRKTFDKQQLEELGLSLKRQGVIEPIVVRPIKNGNYELIAGERRWRAAQLAGLTEIPAVARIGNETEVLALQLVENNQREDVPPMEEAQALQRLVELSDGNKGTVAAALGRSPSWLSKRLSLLKAPEPIKQLASTAKVKDINTLNGLSKLHEESPETAETVVQEINSGSVQGSVRERMEAARKENTQSKQTEQPAQLNEEQIDFVGGPSTLPRFPSDQESLTAEQLLKEVVTKLDICASVLLDDDNPHFQCGALKANLFGISQLLRQNDIQLTELLSQETGRYYIKLYQTEGTE